MGVLERLLISTGGPEGRERESYLRKHQARDELLLKLHIKRESSRFCLAGRCQTFYQSSSLDVLIVLFFSLSVLYDNMYFGFWAIILN